MNMRLLGFGIVLIGVALAPACVSTSYQPIYVDPRAGSVEPALEQSQPYRDDDTPFRDDLAPYGQWVNLSGSGWVWSPYNLPAGWRPYSLGHWVLTDYGWTWASDEDFGWAVYHYGRWNLTPNYGWVWVPGTEWGPAWVAWHEGGGYVGWAPLPSQVRWQAGIGLDWGGININVAINANSWHFVETRHMCDPGLRTYVAPPARNVTLIQVTHNVTNYTYVDNRVINQSVKVETVGRAVGRTIPRYRVMPTEAPGADRGGKVRGQEFVVFKPKANRGRGAQGQPVPPGHQDREHPGNPRDWSEPADAPRDSEPADRDGDRASRDSSGPPPSTGQPGTQNRGPKDHPGRLQQVFERQRKVERATQGPATRQAPAPSGAPSQPESQAAHAGQSQHDGQEQHNGQASHEGQGQRAGSAPPAGQNAASTPATVKGPAKASPAKARAKNPRAAASKASNGKPEAEHTDATDSEKPKSETSGSEK